MARPIKNYVMAKDYVEVEGLDELIRDLAKFGDAAMPALKQAQERAAQVVLAKAKAKAPVSETATGGHAPGTLRDSLKIVRANLKPGTYVTFSKIAIGKGAAYGVPVELGHELRRVVGGRSFGHVAARPFLRPAADESKNEVINIMAEAMNRELERLGD
jgi:HK97 gp10 family phage protein